MKNRSYLILFFVLACTACVQSQNFTEKTNAIQLSYKEGVTPTTLPAITWISPQIESSVSADQFTVLDFSVMSDIPLKDLHLVVTIGGVTRERPIVLQPGDYKKSVQQKMLLTEGENIIKVVAVNEKGGTVSSTRRILMGKDALTDAVDVNRKDYALIFVTDQYDNWVDLVNPINDGRTIESILKEKYGFQTEVVENATLEDISGKLYDYNTKKFNPQDQLFVFFAGHGYFDDVLGEGYVVASNSQLNDKGKASYLSHNILRERLNNIKCEHIFLTMDVCFGGTFDPVLAKATRGAEMMDEAADKRYLVTKLSRTTRKYLTSGSKEYVPDGAPGKHSPFAAKFIQALREKGGTSGRILSLTQLYPYFIKLPTEVRNGSFGKDDPASDFVFVANR